jgi:alpha-1,2-mannosyltransferase
MKYADESLTPRQRRWVQIALIIWGVFAVALCLKILVEGNSHSVYGAFVSGPRGWWSDSQMYVDRGYYYSPTFSVLFTPFAVFPDRIGQLLWGLSSVGLFVWSLRVFFRDALPEQWPRETEAAFLGLALIGSLRGIWSLQSNAILMACILFGAAAMLRCRWWRAAWLLAAPIYIKVWPVVIAGLFSVHAPRKLLPRLALATVALAAVPFATKAPSAVAAYYQTWMNRLADRQVTADRFTGYRDAWTIWEQISTPVNQRAFFLLQAGAGLAVLGFTIWLRNKKFRTAEFVTYMLAAWATWQLLFGPGSERLTYLIAAPFAAWALIKSYLARQDFWLALTAFFTMFLIGMGSTERLLAQLSPSAIAIQPIGVIVFAVWLVRHAIHDSARQFDAISLKRTESNQQAPSKAA